MDELKLTGKHTEEDFFLLYRKCKNVRLRERYQAMYLSFSFDWKTIAKIIGRKYKTILAWIKAYNERGLEGLGSYDPTGRPSRMTSKQMEKLKRTIQMSPRKLGLKFSNWNCKNIGWWIAKEFHVKLCKEAVRKILHKLGFVLIKPKYKYALADEHERKRYLRRFRRKFKGLTKNDLLLFLDETIIRQHPILKTKWILKGSREYVKTFGNHAKTHIFGAISHTLGKTFHMKSRKLNSEVFMDFIKHLITLNPTKRLVLVIDNAPWHKSVKVKEFLKTVSDKVQVLWLPVYSPDFNPIEHLWNFMKQIISNFFFPTIKEMNTAITDFFKSIYHQTEKIMTLCSADYLVG